MSGRHCPPTRTMVQRMYHQMSATARDAFERGDEVLQLAIPLNQQSGRVGPTGGFLTRWDASNELNRIARQGWCLLAASVVFVPTTEVSRDKSGHDPLTSVTAPSFLTAAFAGAYLPARRA
jgi:hypothetical protein